MTTFSLSRVFAGGKLLKNGDFSRFGTPDDAESGSLVFCENLEYLERAARNPGVTAILAPQDCIDRLAPEGKGLISTDTPRVDYWIAFSSLVEAGELRPRMDFGRGAGCRIHPTAMVSERAYIGDGVVVDAHAYVGEYSELGPGAWIGPGACVAIDGLQNVRAGGRLIYVKHAGGARIGKGAVLLAQAIVQRAVYPTFTRVGHDTHISVRSSIGHESIIGQRCSIAGNCQLGGSVIVGDDVVIGLSSTLKDGIRVGSGARIRIGSVVIEDVEAGGDVSGNFALAHRAHLLAFARRRTR